MGEQARPFDLDFVRAQFPAFEVQELNNRAFFENAGGSFACGLVQDRLARFYRERKMQPYWPYPPSSDGGAEMDEARARLAAMMGVDTDELSFGPSTTQNTYVLAQAFGEWLREGDAIIVTNQDHEANSGPWRRLAARGIAVREWKIDPETGHMPLEGLPRLLDDKVRLVCFPHCSNIVAEINPVAEITSIVHQAGAYVCVDGVSYAPHGIPDVGELGADIYLYSAYKVYGPHQGIMAIRRDLGMALPNQGHHFNAGSLEKRFTPAGPDHAQIAASAGIADYFDALHAHHFGGDATPRARAAMVHKLLRDREIALAAPLLDYLASRNSLRIIGPLDAAKRAPTIAVHSDRRSDDLAVALAEHGIMAGGDHFYSVRPLQGMGFDPDHGVLRMSLVHYTSEEDVARLIDALDQVL